LSKIYRRSYSTRLDLDVNSGRYPVKTGFLAQKIKSSKARLLHRILLPIIFEERPATAWNSFRVEANQIFPHASFIVQLRFEQLLSKTIPYFLQLFISYLLRSNNSHAAPIKMNEVAIRPPTPYEIYWVGFRAFKSPPI